MVDAHVAHPTIPRICPAVSPTPTPEHFGGFPPHNSKTESYCGRLSCVCLLLLLLLGDQGLVCIENVRGNQVFLCVTAVICGLVSAERHPGLLMHSHLSLR